VESVSCILKEHTAFIFRVEVLSHALEVEFSYVGFFSPARFGLPCPGYSMAGSTRT
jgi:hypothetical protein